MRDDEQSLPKTITTVKVNIYYIARDCGKPEAIIPVVVSGNWNAFPISPVLERENLSTVELQYIYIYIKVLTSQARNDFSHKNFTFINDNTQYILHTQACMLAYRCFVLGDRKKIWNFFFFLQILSYTVATTVISRVYEVLHNFLR